MKLRKVQIRHFHEISKRDAPPKTNFSAISPFEAEGLTDLRDNDLEAIPTDMLRAIDESAPTELPDLRHISDSQSKKLFRDLCNEYPELFRATISSIEVNVKPKKNLGGFFAFFHWLMEVWPFSSNFEFLGGNLN